MDVGSLFFLPLIVALALFPGWRVNDQVVTRWGGSAGLQLSADGRRAAAHYLRWTKRTRSAGGVLGLAIPYLLWALAGAPGHPPLPLGWMLLGYVGGALVAEIRVHQQPTPGGAAVLAPRRLPDYLSWRLLPLQRGLAVAAVLLLALLVWAPWAEGRRELGVGDGRSGHVVLALSAPLVAVVAEGLQRVIVGRRQVVVDDEDARLDDAFRSYSVQALAGAALAMLCFVVSSLVFELGHTLGAPPPVASVVVTNALGVLGGVLLLATVVFWVGLAEPRRLRIRRLSGLRSPA